MNEDDTSLQHEYQMAISKSQQCFIKSKLDAIKQKKDTIITIE
jgi:hypothetical protein